MKIGEVGYRLENADDGQQVKANHNITSIHVFKLAKNSNESLV